MKSANIIVSPVNIETRKALGIRAGDTVRVRQKVVERTTTEGKWKTEKKERARIQDFEGLVLAVKHGAEPGATFTVRKTIDGVGVERIFPLYSPLIDSIEIIRRARVRRSKLYHIRDKAAKEIRRQMRSELHVKEQTKTEPGPEVSGQGELTAPEPSSAEKTSAEKTSV